MKIVFLPGLDGTGLLFRDVIHALPEKLNIDVVNLNNLNGVSYYDQAVELAQQFKAEDLILVGESYSGRIVYELCQLLDDQVKAVILVASFVSSPSAISNFAGLLPKIFFRKNILTKLVIQILGFNFSDSNKKVNDVIDSLEKSDQIKLQSRMKNIATLDLPNKHVTCEAVYIQPSRDFLVNDNARKTIRIIFKNCDFVGVKGGHFIAQSNPKACADIIKEVIFSKIRC